MVTDVNIIYNSQDMEIMCPSMNEWAKKMWYLYTVVYIYTIE